MWLGRRGLRWLAIRSAGYDLAPDRVIAGMTLRPPKGWRPDLALPLDEAIPARWDPVYEGLQPFQPVKFWRSAVELAGYIEARGCEDAATLLRRLIERLDSFTETDERGAAYVVNRFPWEQSGQVIPPPWFSGIVNAFAILGLARAAEVLPDPGIRDRIRALAEAYRLVHVEGRPPPPRWISFLDRRGRLWFEEYPMPGGQPNCVLNGHIYAVHALHEAHRLWPRAGYDRLVAAGAAAVALTIHEFRRPRRRNLYSLRGQPKGDYLPPRTIRQMHELHALTGDLRFGRAARSFGADFATFMPEEEIAQLHENGRKLQQIRRRALKRAGVRRRTGDRLRARLAAVAAQCVQGTLRAVEKFSP